jgi:hypothetical protein
MLHVALVHHPVLDKRNDLVTTAVTNIDIHDIARSCVTFGVDHYWIVTPVEAMHLLTGRILAHWSDGWGAAYNPTRKTALARVLLANRLEDAIERARGMPATPEAAAKVDDVSQSGGERGRPLRVIATSAREVEALPTIAVADAARSDEADTMLVFGTGNGLAPAVFELCDAVFPPIEAGTGYTHLTVRSAVAIYLSQWAAAAWRKPADAGESR